MNMESTPGGRSQPNIEQIHHNGFDIRIRLAENVKYAYVTLRREGITFDTVVLMDTGEIPPEAEISVDAIDVLKPRGSVLQTLVPRVIKEALGIALPASGESVAPENTTQPELDLEGPEFDQRGSTPGRRAFKDLSQKQELG